MPRQPDVRSYGRVFDEVAEDYDRHRPTYPDMLVDRACEGIGPGAAVLEIGCGTGQLTRSLLARGLRVTAVEPGEQLIRIAGAVCLAILLSGCVIEPAWGPYYHNPHYGY